MNQKIVGIIPLMAAMLFVAVFAVGGNSVAAATTDTQTQTASVYISDVIAIVTPGVVSNSYASTTATDLALLNGTNDNNVISKSNGKIDVYIKAADGSVIPNSNTTYGDSLTNFQYQSSGTGAYTDFTNGFVAVIKDWKIPQGTTTDGVSQSVPLKVHVPSYSAEGYYNTTVTYLAVRSGTPAPA